MTNEERIAALEQELERLRAVIESQTRNFQYIGGAGRAYQSAVLAIIQTHPQPEVLGPVLANSLARLDAHIVAKAESEQHLSGFQAVHTMLIDALHRRRSSH